MSSTRPEDHEPVTVGLETTSAPPLVPPAPLPGGTVSRYRPLSLHAKGGLGEVYLAHDEELQRRVALKSIQHDFAHEPDSRQRFLREAEITGKLEHPGIVPVYGLVKGEDGRPCYAMRFIQGDSLREAIKRFRAIADPRERRLQLQRLLRRFIDVCNTIAYAHNRNIIHRDLKPANIMLGPFGETLVVDWGLAKELSAVEEQGSTSIATAPREAMTLQGGVMGTPAYMSPEQAAGQNQEVGPPSDIYALGATLYHLLTGQAPFDSSQDVMSTLEQVVRGQFPPPRQVETDVPRPLEAVCLKAMDRDPARRYSSAGELAEDVERYLADQPVRAWPEPWWVRTRRWMGRHRLLVTGAVSALLVAVLGLGVGLVLLVAANQRTDEARQEAENNQDLADEAREEALKNKRLAERQRDEARKSLQTALSVIDKFSRKVNADPRMRERDLEELRLQLLQSAVTSCRTLMQGKKGDADLQGQMVSIESQLGRLFWQMGDQKKALGQYRRILNALQELKTTAASQHKIDSMIAVAHLDMAVSQIEEGKLQEGEKELLTGHDILVRLVERPGSTDDDRDSLALAKMNLCFLYRKKARHKEGIAHILAAKKIWTELRRKYPKSEHYLECLGQAHINHGAALGKKNREAARKEMEQARDIFVELVKRDTAWPPYRYHLALVAQNLAELSTDRAERLKVFLIARDFLDDLARRSPAMLPYQERLADVCHSTANEQTIRGQFAASQQSLGIMRQAAKRLLTRYPKVVKYHELDAEALLAMAWNARYMGKLEDGEKAALEAVKILTEIVKQQPKSLHYNHRLGWAHNTVGIISRHLEDEKQSVKHHRAALKIRQWLYEQKPANREYRANLASTCTNLANLHSPGPVPTKEAESLFLRSIAIQEKLVKEPIHIDQDVLDYAMSYNNLGILYQQLKRDDEAEKAWKKALEIREGLLKIQPDKIVLLNDIAMSQANLAAHYLKAKDTKKAQACLLKAIEASEKTVKLRPDMEDYVTRLAKLCQDLGDVMWDLAKATEALPLYKRTLAVLGPWEKKGIGRLTPRMYDLVVGGYQRLGDILTELKRYKEALPCYNRCLQICPSNLRNTILYGRARMLAQSGEHRKAVDDLLELLPRMNHPKSKYSLAGLYCLAVAAAQEDKNLSEQQRKDVADLYSRRAVELLREAHKAGLFKDEVYRKSIGTSKALGVLRMREDFKKLLKDLGDKEDEK